MDSRTVATFFALLLVGGLVGLVAAAAVPTTRRQLAGSATALASVVAVAATLGSLYFSEVAHFIPCELCWYQRIAMYPLAVILPIAAVRRDRAVLPYALVLAAGGLVVSLYHVQLQLLPDQSSMCELTNPCTARWVEAFGWMTIPQMAGLSFALIAGLLILTLSVPTRESE
jgi:disulfide bond formation protein DsbB